MRQITQVRDQLAPDGFARFLDRGQWFSEAHYGHGHTVTAAGHAVMLTGAYPQRTGIISNEWRDPKTGGQVYCTQDPAYTYIDSPTPRLAGTSRAISRSRPWATCCAASTRGQVIGISGRIVAPSCPPATRARPICTWPKPGASRPAPTTWPSTRPGSALSMPASRPMPSWRRPGRRYCRGGLRAFGARWPNLAGRHGQRQPAAGRRATRWTHRARAFYGNLLASPLATS